MGYNSAALHKAKPYVKHYRALNLKLFMFVKKKKKKKKTSLSHVLVCMCVLYFKCTEISSL